MKIILTETTINIFENYQLAQKNFVFKNLLTVQELDEIAQKVQNKQYINMYATIFLNIKNNDILEDKNKKNIVNEIFEQLNQYFSDENSKLRIIDFDTAHFTNISNLKYRNNILKSLKILPSSFYRNIIKIIPNKVKLTDLPNLNSLVSGILKIYNQYIEYDNVAANKILSIAFSSKMKNLNEIKTYLQNNIDDIFSVDQKSVQEVITFIKKNNLSDNVETLYSDNKKILIIVVTSHEVLRMLTCNTRFCFSRKDSLRHWESYADNSHVIVVYNFNNKTYSSIMTIILPTDLAYSADNLPIYGKGEIIDGMGTKILKRYGLSDNLINQYIY